MCFFIDPSHCISIGHLECDEIFSLNIESILKFVNGLFEVLVLNKKIILNIELLFNPEFDINNLGQQFGIALLVMFVGFNGLSGNEVE